jgi:UPF0755 protein
MSRQRKKKQGRKKWLRIIYISLIILFASFLLKGYDVYRKVLRSNVALSENSSGYLYIPSNSTFETVCEILSREGIVKNINTFIWVAEKKNYVNHIHAGRFKIKNGMNNNELVNLLRSGKQEPVKVRFQHIRTLEELAGRVAESIEADSASIASLLKDQSFIGQFGFNRAQIIAMFIPNTYEFYWNTSAEAFFRRMAKEYKAFWNDNRIHKAKQLNLSQSEVSTLASIVQAEQTIRPDERPTVAGLYINRLKRGMRLESDPTIIYAKKDFTIKRVLNEYRNIDSPYNTYMYKGLPPGPINIPDISSIDAVLNYEKHDFIFMCAKEDFSGYHNFSRTNSEHNVYAQRYRNELNKRKIYR